MAAEHNKKNHKKVRKNKAMAQKKIHSGEIHTAETRSWRQLKVGEAIKSTLAQFFMREELHEPELKGISISLTEVKISPDLKHASVYYIPLLAHSLSHEKKQAIQKALQGMEKACKQRLARQLTMRNTPKLKFYYDTSFDNVAMIERLIHENQRQ